MTDIEIAQSVALQPIQHIAAKLGIGADDLELYGKYKAKLPLHLIQPADRRKGKLILVSAMTPTPAGEGKTTCSIGLADGLQKLGKRAVAVLREPSLGPVFGMKGGATGGGRSQVAPMADINLHFTGDFVAVERANNLLAAMVDNNLQNKKNTLGINPVSVRFKRVMDMNDRALRKMVVGLGGKGMGIPREAGFDITAASEVMAILCLSQSVIDLKMRLGNIYIGQAGKTPVYARDLKAVGAMALLLKDAVQPNLVQTLEGTPAIIHGGPFANIAQGTNTLLATQMGLGLADYVVTEAGFGFDLGGEKFLDIKCRAGGLSPAAVVLVCTIRGLKYQGGKPLKELTQPDVPALEKGFANLQKHIENVRQFGLRPVVAINRFPTDAAEEIARITELTQSLGAKIALMEGYGRGGDGAVALAQQVLAEADAPSAPFKPLYELGWSIEQKIETVAKGFYGAGAIAYTPQAVADLKLISELGLAGLPICMAKTQYSFSDQPTLLGRPQGFTLTVREVQFAAGAGFVIPIAGEIMRMPGLPEHPAAEDMDIDDNGTITGLS
jgi:formate--tetrahydrofolate ligase